MHNIVIPIDGRETRIRAEQIEIQCLQLDELNPRISFFKDNQVIDTLNQEQIIFALTNKKPDAFRKLKDSIQNNRGIVYAIWVEPIVGSGDKKYRVIEGNSRVVVYQQLTQEEPYEENWKTIFSYVLPKEIDEGQKNFIRLQSHLRGTTEWDAYEKAKYLYKLWDKDGWSLKRLEKQTKMTEREIDNNINAYRIMEEQYLPKHSDDPNEVTKFSYFVEFVKDKKLQNLLEQNAKSINDFCDWVADKDKIPRGEDVRKLRAIFENQNTRAAFDNKGFDAAIQVLELQKPHLVSKLYREIEIVTEGLKEISSEEIDEMKNDHTSAKREMIRELAKWSQKVLKLLE
jgi:hypothetical protein